MFQRFSSFFNVSFIVWLQVLEPFVRVMQLCPNPGRPDGFIENLEDHSHHDFFFFLWQLVNH